MEKQKDRSKRIEDWDCEYPKGWRTIVHKLHADIESVSPGHKITQVKEKLGRLCYYCAVPTKDRDAIRKIIYSAEEETKHTCQVCGKPDVLKPESWWATLCYDHRNSKEGNHG